jgi:hypothetical protein
VQTKGEIMIKEKECAVEGCQEFPSTGMGFEGGKEIGLCPTCFNNIVKWAKEGDK